MAKKIIWNNCKKIGEVKKSDRTKVVVELVARDGVKYINIRMETSNGRHSNSY